MKCSLCKVDKPESEFRVRASTGNLRKDCKQCCRVRQDAWDRKNSDKVKAYKKAYARKPENREASRIRDKATDRTEINKRYNAGHRKEIAARNAAWKAANPWKFREYWTNRRAAKLERTPAWFGETDGFIVEEAAHLAMLRERVTGFRWEIDHVIPLRGKLVSGLHIGVNLAVIPRVANRSKYNKFTPS